MLLHGKSPREVGKKQRKTTEKHGKSEEKPKFWTKSAWKGLVRGGEMARKAQRKSLEWGFARKSGGQYGVSKLRGWRKVFYNKFRWDERARITRIKRITVLPQMARMDTDVRVRWD